MAPADPQTDRTDEDALDPTQVEEAELEEFEDEPEEPPLDIDALVGEYDETAGEDIDIAAGGTENARKLEEIPAPLLEVMEKRLGIYRRLTRLQELRDEITRNAPDLPDEIKAELRRQSREASRLPDADGARKSIEGLMKNLSAASDRVKNGEMDRIHPRAAEAYRLAFQQWRLCIDLAELMPKAIEAGLPLLEDEPLHKLLKAANIDTAPLFGLTAYAAALEIGSERAGQRRKVLQANLTALEQRNRGLLGRLRRADKDEAEEQERLRASEAQQSNNLSYMARERSSLEPEMVKAFWSTYKAAARLLMRDDIPPGYAVRLRAFLRYGMISDKEWLLDKDASTAMLCECQEPQQGFCYSMSEYHILYADEYLQLVARNCFTPSIDENLELNERHSDAWKADRMLRRYIGTLFKETALSELEESLGERIRVLREEQAELEERKEKLTRNTPDFKKINNQLGQQIQHCKVEAARLQRAIDRIHEKYMPQQLELRAEATAKLEANPCRVTPEATLDREAEAMHRMSRLCAKLQDPFPPFALRDNYKVGTDAVNNRDAILHELQEIEKRDPTIFKDVLMPVRKASQRLYMRFCPILLLAPGCGFMGYSWNPRSGPEVGRLVLPAYMPRPGIRERVLHSLLADFRWDTSKASAGVDLLTSDTLVAAYATVRWDYRRRSKEVREKSAIYTEENDRTNWRRHYTLFLQSAMEGGKRLYFKCYEAYEVVVKYLGMPEGVERLKR